MYVRPPSRCRPRAGSRPPRIDTSSADTGSSRTDEIGFEGQRPRDPDPLPLSARELVREPVGVLRREADGAQQLVDALLALVAAPSCRGSERLADDVAHGHARVQRCVWS